jgi:hypothetical protein
MAVLRFLVIELMAVPWPHIFYGLQLRHDPGIR